MVDNKVMTILIKGSKYFTFEQSKNAILIRLGLDSLLFCNLTKPLIFLNSAVYCSIHLNDLSANRK